MKAFIVAIVAVLAVSSAYPKADNTITYEDENGNIITENLDSPTPTTFAVTISKLDFMLYTRANSKTPCKLILGDTTLVKNCGFNSAVDTVILIHGWQNNYDSEATQVIKDAYLAKSNINVLILGYKEYNSPYLSAVSSAPKVGESLGQFISFLVSSGNVKLNRLHIIGHSLGAHIAAFAAQSVNSGSSKVGRITGLDPAGPSFGGKKPDGRISEDDAIYVDVIHSSTAFGMAEPVGHADFFPNGGEAQPECTQALISGGCDHSSSFRYYAKSIADPNTYPALKCANVADARSVAKAPTACAVDKARMGESAASTAPAGTFFVGV